MGILKHPWRVFYRGVWFVCELGFSAVTFVGSVALADGEKDRNRVLWLQSSCRRVLRVFDVSISTAGEIPQSGFLACNHLSYIDILALSAITPCIFIAKRQVGIWPVLGWFAKRSGCLFIDRQKRSDVARLNREMQRHLAAGLLLVLFPEGTSTDGQSLLPFKSSLMEPVAQSQATIFAGRIEYQLKDGDVRCDVCYWGDMTLVPHGLNLLSKRDVQARIAFSRITEPPTDRKELARKLQERVLALALANTEPKSLPEFDRV